MIYPEPSLIKNDSKAKTLILVVSVIVFAAVVFLSKYKLEADLPFDKHVFAKINAVINSIVAILLLLALMAVKRKKYIQHRNIMLTAIVLSLLFLLSYIAHHLFAGETKFGDLDHDGMLSIGEKSMVGGVRIIYYILLLTHIPLAAVVLPFILFTAYRGLTGEYARHKKMARITWPLWLYVAISGVVVYWLIQPYYY
jgi:putative membrane protein